MLKKSLLILSIVLIIPLIGIQAQQAPLPQGIFDALSDLSVKVGKSFRIDCTDPNDSSTCKANDGGLIWSWKADIYPDASLGCPQPGQSYAQGQTRGFQYLFTYNNINYDYRQSADRTVLFLCTSGGPQITTTGTPGAPAAPIDPALCPLPPRLTAGQTAKVGDQNDIPNRMRASAGINGAYLIDIPAGGQFTVIGGPVCADRYVWWQVNYNGTVGWTAEGEIDSNGSPDYWLEPLGGAGSNLAAGLQPLTSANASAITQIAAQSLPFNIRDAAYWNGFKVIALTSGTFVRLQTHDNWQANASFNFGQDGQELAHVAVTENAQGQRWMATSHYNASTDTASIKIWTVGAVDTGLVAQEVRTLPFPVRLISDMDFRPDGTQLAVTGSDGTRNLIQIYEVITGNVIASIDLTAFPQTFAYNPQTSRIAIVTDDSQIRLIDVPFENAQLQGYNPNNIQGGQHAVTINALGTRLAYTGNENILQLWDLTNNTVLREIPLPINGGVFVASDVVFSPDGTLVVVAGGIELLNQGETQVYDVATGNLLARIPVFARQIQFAGNNAVHLFTADPAPLNNWYLYGVK